MPSNAPEYAKKYYENNKQHIKERSEVKWECEHCGVTIRGVNQKSHERSRRHRDRVTAWEDSPKAIYAKTELEQIFRRLTLVESQLKKDT